MRTSIFTSRRSSAFLNAPLNEDDGPIYMEMPPGCDHPEYPQKDFVMRLNKAVYGLKQLLHAWNITFSEHLRALGYIPHMIEPCVFCHEEYSDTHKRNPISATHGLKQGPCVTDPAAIGFYATAMGALLWPAVTACPEIGFAISMLSLANHFFTKGHMNTIKHIITYNGRRRFIEHTFANANWGTDHNRERKSQSSFIVMLAGGAISWGSKCQKSVALSTKEAEFYVISEATAVTLTTQQNLQGLGYKVDTLTIIFNDNQGIIAAFSDPLADLQPKHINIKYNFACDAANNGAIILNYIRSADNWANIFTKALPYPLFLTLRAQILNSHSDVEINNDNTRSGYSIQMPSAKTMIEDHCVKFDHCLDFQIWQEHEYVGYAN
ncbi:Pol-like polyprotein/retrotransposon, putative [Rhizoctonia solani AG-3 Rhs1AP]|uniref:Pol-like polyprotein/retrotransposon, putative n=1 Tax=Rhizoctonia solani AG-3 Rhs1AP TaxID=1086054 RepID=X8JXJ3_9AGAM|nr:Pol-like polyprotein/retrotransposon, putative [Rhizoctonia solani AG-3 Rhs1AP]